MKKIKGLKMQIIPFTELNSLSTAERVKKILNLVLDNRIVIIHGKLQAEEEARLIEDTMAIVGHVKGFRGIELAVIEPNLKEGNIFLRMKHGIAKSLIGESRALTIVGPASIVKEIKRDPKKIELLLK